MSKNYVCPWGPGCVLCKAGKQAQPATAAVSVTDTATGEHKLLTGKAAKKIQEFARRIKNSGVRAQDQGRT